MDWTGMDSGSMNYCYPLLYGIGKCMIMKYMAGPTDCMDSTDNNNIINLLIYRIGLNREKLTKP